MNLYLVLDVPAEKIYSAFLAETDADALRGMLFQLTRQKPKRDLKFIRACEVDVKKFQVHESSFAFQALQRPAS